MATLTKGTDATTAPRPSQTEGANMPTRPLHRKSSFAQEKASGEGMVGRTIEVLWFDEETGESWEKAVINEFNDLDKTHLVVYEDGDQDWYDLADLKYRIPANAETTEKGFLAERHLVKTFSAIGMAGTALVGQRVEVFWTHDKDPDQGKWWAATIKEFRKEFVIAVPSPSHHSYPLPLGGGHFRDWLWVYD